MNIKNYKNVVFSFFLKKINLFSSFRKLSNKILNIINNFNKLVIKKNNKIFKYQTNSNVIFLFSTISTTPL